MKVTISDYETLEPYSFKLPTSKACDFSWGDRFQTVAIDENNRLVGRWSFTPFGENASLHSHHTWVSGGYRRHGVAVRLWLAGIARWKPSTIEATIVSWNGAALLARMKVELAGSVELIVKSTDWMPTFHKLLGESALRRIVLTRERTAITPPSTLRLEAVK